MPPKVSRTVELMKMLAAKVEKDGKAEEDLYETFVCWAKSIVSQKTQSNEAAKNVISERSTYIADLAAGRIELTDERVTLEKQIKSLTDELESLKATREKENSDFEDAKAEMEMAVKALRDAVDTSFMSKNNYVPLVLYGFIPSFPGLSHTRIYVEIVLLGSLPLHPFMTLVKISSLEKALGDAIDVLKVSTEGAETGVFVQESQGYNQKAYHNN